MSNHPIFDLSIGRSAFPIAYLDYQYMVEIKMLTITIDSLNLNVNNFFLSETLIIELIKQKIQLVLNIKRSIDFDINFVFRKFPKICCIVLLNLQINGNSTDRF